MALITRISRLFHADMHAVLDHIEEPDLLLKQAIREMSDSIAQDETRLKLLKHEQQQFSRQETELTESLTDLDQQLALCFKSNKEDLARTLIKRKLETQQTLKSLSHKIRDSKEAADKLTTQLVEQRSQLESMKQKATLFEQENSSTQPSTQWNNPNTPIHADDIEVAFLHENQKWSAS